jgi:hypothetical protein
MLLHTKKAMMGAMNYADPAVGYKDFIKER